MEALILFILFAVIIAIALIVLAIRSSKQKEQRRRKEVKQRLKEEFKLKVEEYKKKTVVQKTAHEIAQGFTHKLAERFQKNISPINISRRIYSYKCIGIWMDDKTDRRESDWSSTFHSDYGWGIDFAKANLQRPKDKYEMYAITTAIAELTKQYFLADYQKHQWIPSEYKTEYKLALIDETMNPQNSSGDAIFFLEYSAGDQAFNNTLTAW